MIYCLEAGEPGKVVSFSSSPKAQAQGEPIIVQSLWSPLAWESEAGWCSPGQSLKAEDPRALMSGGRRRWTFSLNRESEFTVPPTVLSVRLSTDWMTPTPPSVRVIFFTQSPGSDAHLLLNPHHRCTQKPCFTSDLEHPFAQSNWHIINYHRCKVCIQMLLLI